MKDKSSNDKARCADLARGVPREGSITKTFAREVKVMGDTETVEYTIPLGACGAGVLSIVQDGRAKWIMAAALKGERLMAHRCCSPRTVALLIVHLES